MKGIITFASRVNPEFSVLVIYKEFINYPLVKQSLEGLDNSIGALMPGQKVILIDGERIQEEGLNDNHVLAIEAHEIAHELLGHDGERNQSHEREADELAIKILRSLGRKEAADLLIEREETFQ
jgi:hypothetical protein